jgi:hypothetical protein
VATSVVKKKKIVILGKESEHVQIVLSMQKTLFLARNTKDIHLSNGYS